MDGIKVIKGKEGKGRRVRTGDAVEGVFHKALGSACVSLEPKAFIAYHTSHKASMEDTGKSVNIKQVHILQ